ncbi:hypothetical protein IJJ39_02130 [Candidatus Saccharibacteria bacterium]|nr:hypothetical protein [Candidatus Saccharibacteria bacterium]
MNSDGMNVGMNAGTPSNDVSSATGAQMMPNVTNGGVASNGATVVEVPRMRDAGSLIKTIVIVVLSLVSVTFVGLFIWMNNLYMTASEDVNGQINAAVAEAKYEQAVKLEEEFAEREKEPYDTFTGPVDYGQLSFKYPKTWSVYVAADAAKGGDFEAYFNPGQVNVVSASTINALRVTVRDIAFEDVVQEYQRAMDRTNSNLTVETITVAGTTANLYTGTIPNTELSGYIVIFKIRDKTAVFQTDSVLFKADFDKVLESVSFNA